MNQERAARANNPKPSAMATVKVSHTGRPDVSPACCLTSAQVPRKRMAPANPVAKVRAAIWRVAGRHASTISKTMTNGEAKPQRVIIMKGTIVGGVSANNVVTRSMCAFGSNENKMSDGGRRRASIGVKMWKSSQK